MRPPGVEPGTLRPGSVSIIEAATSRCPTATSGAFQFAKYQLRAAGLIVRRAGGCPECRVFEPPAPEEEDLTYDKPEAHKVLKPHCSTPLE